MVYLREGDLRRSLKLTKNFQSKVCLFNISGGFETLDKLNYYLILAKKGGRDKHEAS